MLPALLHRIWREVVLADGDDACDDRDDLCDVLARGRWSWTTNSVDDVLDCHYDGGGLSFEARLEDRKSVIRKTGDAEEETREETNKRTRR